LLKNRQDGESIMISSHPKATNYNNKLLLQFESVKELIANIRTVRLTKNIPNKETIDLQLVSGFNDEYFNAVVTKLCNLSSIKEVSEKDPTAVSFLVATTEYAIPLGNNINVEEELKKLKEELKYTEGFLQSVMKKLGNEKFVTNAPANVLEMEQKKQADAESKINLLKQSIQAFET